MVLISYKKSHAILLFLFSPLTMVSMCSETSIYKTPLFSQRRHAIVSSPLLVRSTQKTRHIHDPDTIIALLETYHKKFDISPTATDQEIYEICERYIARLTLQGIPDIENKETQIDEIEEIKNILLENYYRGLLGFSWHQYPELPDYEESLPHLRDHTYQQDPATVFRAVDFLFGIATQEQQETHEEFRGENEDMLTHNKEATEQSYPANSSVRVPERGCLVQ